MSEPTLAEARGERTPDKPRVTAPTQAPAPKQKVGAGAGAKPALAKLKRTLAELIGAYRGNATHLVPLYTFNLGNALNAAVAMRGQATDAEREELADLEKRSRKLLAATNATPAAPPKGDSKRDIDGLRVDWSTVASFIDVIAPGTGRFFTQSSQVFRDVFESIARSPLHAQTVFGEQWNVIKDHWHDLMKVMATLVAAEVAIGVLAATPDPTMGTKVAAVALQALLIVFAIHAAYEAGNVAGAYAKAWLANVQAANGDLAMIDAAALNFARMVFSLVQAIGAVFGIRAAARIRPTHADKPLEHTPRHTNENARPTDHAQQEAPAVVGVEIPVDRSQLSVVTHKSTNGWSFDLNARLPDGSTHRLGQTFVGLDQGKPLGGPNFTIDKIAVNNKDRIQVYQSGKKVSVTDLVLDEAIAAFKKDFGYAPELLPGGLAWENLLNFQRAYATAVRDGLKHEAANQSAIRQISFGRSRAERGYDNFSVDATEFANVNLGAELGTQYVPTRVNVKAWRKK